MVKNLTHFFLVISVKRVSCGFDRYNGRILHIASCMTCEVFPIYFRYKSCESDQMSSQCLTWQVVFAQNQRATSRSQINDEQEHKYIVLLYTITNSAIVVSLLFLSVLTFFSAKLRMVSNQTADSTHILRSYANFDGSTPNV